MARDLELGIDERVTPSLHPQVVASLEDFDSDTEGELQQVVEAFTHAYETVGKVLDAREAVENDLTLTPADRVLRVADVADKVMERATRAFDKAAANSMLNDFNLRVMQEAETLTDDLTNQIFTVRTQDIQADIFFANKAKK